MIDIAERRLAPHHAGQVKFLAGDMLSDTLGHFDHVVAMDSLIYCTTPDIVAALDGLKSRTAGNVVFTVAPHTTLLMTMWYAGKLFPRSDRSPVMIPQCPTALSKRVDGLTPLERVTSGFYISQAVEVA